MRSVSLLLTLLCACGPITGTNQVLQPGEGAARASLCGVNAPVITEIQSDVERDTWTLEVTVADADGDLHDSRMMIWAGGDPDGRVLIDQLGEGGDNRPKIAPRLREGEPCEVFMTTYHFESTRDGGRWFDLGFGELQEFGVMVQDAEGNLSRLRTSPIRAPYSCDIFGCMESSSNRIDRPYKMPLYGIHPDIGIEDGARERRWALPIPPGTRVRTFIERDAIWDIERADLNVVIDGVTTWSTVSSRRVETVVENLGDTWLETEVVASRWGNRGSLMFDVNVEYEDLAPCTDDAFGPSTWALTQPLPANTRDLVRQRWTDEVWEVRVPAFTTLQIQGEADERSYLPFGLRNNERESLGDWDVLPSGLSWTNETVDPQIVYIDLGRSYSTQSTCMTYSLDVRMESTRVEGRSLRDLHQFQPLVINEWMANPTATTDAKGEWLELYNRTDEAVDLHGLWIEDLVGSEGFQIEEHYLLGGQGYVVLGRNADLTTNGGVPVDIEMNGFILRNTHDAISLRYEDLSYGARTYDSTTAGRSSQNQGCLSSHLLPNGDYGTPGEPNTPCAP